MAKRVVLNPGAQKAFVKNDARASAFIGGLGSGKTFSIITRGLEFSSQPLAEGTMYGPRGLVGATSYGVLRKVVQPQFFELLEGTGLWKTGKRTTSWQKSEMKASLIANCGCADPHGCEHVTEIFLASLDDPDELRGMELSWFAIDEGRNTTAYAWEVLYGRLRQQGYKHGGWVGSTPNGFDWMYSMFHPDSPKRLDGAVWFGAPTMENVHLPDSYIEGLTAMHHGRQYEQEVLGHFVGMTEGAVYFEWDMKDAAHRIEYDPKLELYSEWDFGMGDLNVVLFFQLSWREHRPPGELQATLMLPVKHYVGAMEANNVISGDWAKRFHAYCDQHFSGRRPKLNIGDPAGRQRNQVTGTSVIDDLYYHGVTITPAPKKPVDYAVRIMNNMMADHRILVDKDRCERLGQALASHKWAMNALGVKTSNTPVHDWTSHYSDAARYGTTIVIPNVPTAKAALPEPEYGPGTAGYIFGQVLAREDDDDEWLGEQDDEEPIKWVPTAMRPRAS